MLGLGEASFGFDDLEWPVVFFSFLFDHTGRRRHFRVTPRLTRQVGRINLRSNPSRHLLGAWSGRQPAYVAKTPDGVEVNMPQVSVLAPAARRRKCCFSG
jgi:hypothetical protein